MNIYSEMLAVFGRSLSASYITVAGGGSYCVERRGSELFVFFEGSNGEEDWVNNLDFPSIPYSDMPCKWRCHRGFVHVFKSLLPHIKEPIFDCSVSRITVCGYSHGGALALLCHEYAWYNRADLRANRLRSFAIGAPRVIFAPRGICTRLEERFVGLEIVRNIDDLVTHLPPLLLGYTHPREPILIGERGRYSRIDAHRSENYLAELAAASERVEKLKNNTATG